MAVGRQRHIDTMSYRDWLNSLPKSDAEYVSVGCPTCGASGSLEYQYFGFPESDFGWKLVWCSMCHTGISVSRVRIPQGAPRHLRHCRTSEIHGRGGSAEACLL